MRVDVMGCPVDNVTMDEAVDCVGRFIQNGGAHQGVAVNADKFVMARRDPEMMAILRRTDLIYADGMPVVWASRILGAPLKARVTGIDLFSALVARAAETGWRVYLLGAREDVVSELAKTLTARYPTLVIAGHRNGYWSPEEESGVAQAIAASKADLLFVAISSPKKERFLDAHQAAMSVPYAMGVGGTFDVLTGRVKRAPRWMQRFGLEWFYRFLQEPRRMFRRYFITDMAFLGMLLSALISRRFLRKPDGSH